MIDEGIKSGKERDKGCTVAGQNSNGRAGGLGALDLSPALHGGGGNDVAVRVGLVPLDHIAVFCQAGAEEMNQKRVRRVAGHRHGCRHGSVSFVPMREIGGPTSSPGRSSRRPAHGRHSPLDGGRRADGDGCGAAAQLEHPAAPVAGQVQLV